MDKRFPQYDELDLPKLAAEILKQWEAEDTFGQSLELRKGRANGLPGANTHVPPCGE